jgi:hypothetical protein
MKGTENAVAAGDWAVPTENICLHNTLLDADCSHELREIDRHEIIVRICEIIGPCPSNLSRAEEIFDKLRYDVANFVLHHDYDSSRGVSADLLLWLDSRVNPHYVRKFRELMGRFF